MPRPYKVVDVFTHEPFQGNPVAVVLDAQGLDTAAMQRIAHWTNLSETTFVLPPTQAGADYQLRIFTPRSELPFAGHPTLGSAHAVLEAGLATARDGRLVQQCGVGLVTLHVQGEGAQQQLAFEVPPATLRPLGDADVHELQQILGAPLQAGVAPAIVDVGAVWIIAQVPDAASLLALQPDYVRSAVMERRLGVTGVTVFARQQGDAAVQVRSFAPSSGVNEDPVCGSGNASVALFLRERGLLAQVGVRYVAAQGQCVARNGRVVVDASSQQVTLGGACVTCVEGVLAG
jgi:predicted PhzF superfamily epimerase YddE/YHI9